LGRRRLFGYRLRTVQPHRVSWSRHRRKIDRVLMAERVCRIAANRHSLEIGQDLLTSQGGNGTGGANFVVGIIQSVGAFAKLTTRACLRR
jgi:hypothetical protein